MALFSRKDKEEDVNYWQSISDVMAGLLLVVLLVMMLFILYMTRMPDVDHIDEFYTSEEDEGEHVDDEWGNRYHSILWAGDNHYEWKPGKEYDWRPEHEYDDPDGAAGGGGGYGKGDQPGDYEYEQPGIGDWEGDQKAAVHVFVRDGETGLSIKEAGITFELFDGKNQLKKLYSYYPQKTEYTSYATVQAGTFYLPEKVGLGGYRLTEISVPYGYDAAQDVEFFIDESKDWPDPYLVFVDLFPCRNVIRVQSTDSVTGVKVPGAVYEVVASTDIVTADGTTRYTAGQVVDTISCDDLGYGESMELYLGEYSLRQVTPPQYYASSKDAVTVFVDRKDRSTDATMTNLPQERTRYALALRDELYEEQGLSQIRFILTEKNGEGYTELTTDSLGNIRLNELKKDTEYILDQTETAEGYEKKLQSVSFRVTADGRIEGEAGKEETVTNRMIRITVGVNDVLLGNELADTSMALYDGQEKLVRLWSSSALPEEIDGLEPGTYRLLAGGQNSTEIEIEDVKEIQKFDVKVWSGTSIALVSAGGLAGLTGLGIGAVFLKKKTAKRRK